MIKKVLIVEDENLIVSTIKALLNTMNINYFTAENGEIALDEFKKNSYDLVITDIFMPKMDGFQLIEEIRKLSKDIPIIVISGYIDNETIRRIKHLGANEYIEKPFSLKDVKETINFLIGENI